MNVLYLFLFVVFVFAVLFVYCFVKTAPRVQPFYAGSHDIRSPLQIEVNDIHNIFEYTDAESETKKYPVKSHMYKAHDSNEQIRTVAERGSLNEICRLVQLIAKHIGRSNYESFQLSTKLVRRPDQDVYAELCKHFDRKEDERAYFQAVSLYQPLRVHTAGKFAKYLDIGCGIGTITSELRKLIDSKETHCVEVKPYEHADIKYTMIPYDGSKLEYTDGAFDLVTAFMSLHHVVRVEDIIREVNRVLSVGGIFYIKEHDCWNAIDAMLIDIEHNIFTYCNEPDNPDKNPYMAHYKNYWSWFKLIESSGFKLMASNYYFASLSNNITPTRAFWAIFKKIE
jgi:ubiquinone/menaquinone biosynthesis C-methylase UbiE